MAAGDVTREGRTVAIKLLEGVASANGAPSGAAAGVELAEFLKYAGPAALASIVYSQSGTDTQTCAYLRAWGYHAAVGEWFPMGIGTDADKGKLNDTAANALGETETDKVLHAEPIGLVGHCTRFYLEVGAQGGTSPSGDAWLIAGEK